MKKWLVLFALLALCIPTFIGFAQEMPTPTIEITGANATELPIITITTNVLDSSNRPVDELTPADFTLGGALAEHARIVNVEHISRDDLPFATVLVLDVSSSMTGLPLAQAQAAARQFIQSIGPDDPVALVTFSTDVWLVQDFTTDKDLLLNAIDTVAFGGQTALYDAAVFAAEHAATAPVPRRAVILLSDGAEYGGASESLRADGLERSLVRGVSMYTIGLGFGIDRSYLQDLSGGTNARNYESPTPDELGAIYAELAALFRTQYVLTLESDIPFDGTEYPFTLQANTPNGLTNEASGIVRAPIPVPLVSLPEGIFDAPISEPLTVTPVVRADDEISAMEVLVNGETVELVDGAVTIDPLNFAPGRYPFALRVTDADGDASVLDAEFEIAALPSVVTVNWSPGDAALVDPQTVTIAAEGQTDVVSVDYAITGAGQLSGQSTDAASSFAFTFDPFELPAGSYTMSIAATNAGGVATGSEVPFTVGAIAPRDIVISGVELGQILEEPTEISATATTQAGAEIASVSYELEGHPGAIGEDHMINPAGLAPGETNLLVTVTDSQGQTSTQRLTFLIAALPPHVELGELPEEMTAFTTVPVSINSQTPIISVVYQFNDGVEIPLQATSAGTYPDIPVDAVGLGNGEYTLLVTVTNEAGQVATAESSFVIAVPTPTPLPTTTADATGTADALAATSAVQATNEAQAAQDTQATASAEAQAQAASLQATTDAQATLDAQSTLDAATAEPTEEATAEATQEAAAVDVTEEATIEATEEAAVDATEEATVEVTEEAAVDVTEAVTEEATAEMTEEAATEEATLVAAAPTEGATSAPETLPTLTPMGDIVEVQSQDAPPAEGNLSGVLMAVCGMGLLAVLLFLMVRGRRREE